MNLTRIKQFAFVAAIALFAFGGTVGIKTWLAGHQSTPSYKAQANFTNVTSPVVSTEAGDNSSTKIDGFGVARPQEPNPHKVVKRIKDLELDISRTIELYGPVGVNAIYAAITITRMNQDSNKPIFLLLDSPGGSVLTGARLISAMQTSKAPIFTVCTNMCASMAFMIHQYGVKRFALDRAILMSHPATVGYEGDVDRISSFIGTIKRYTNKLEAEVAQRMGLSFQAYKQKIQNEYWVDAEDALKDNVVDQLVNITLEKAVKLPELSADQKAKVNTKREFDIIWMISNVKQNTK
jgi:ATP-dependent Clp endopeptidase proteolytic subunit ClpP